MWRRTDECEADDAACGELQNITHTRRNGNRRAIARSAPGNDAAVAAQRERGNAAGRSDFAAGFSCSDAPGRMRVNRAEFR